MQRRQATLPGLGSAVSISFTFICEGAQSAIINDIGELGRAVLPLKPQPAH